MSDSPGVDHPSSSPQAPRRAANVTLLAAALLLLFTAAALFTGRGGRVGYGWATLAAGLLLGGFGAGMRRGLAACAWGASAVFAALLAFWGLRLTQRLDLGPGIWSAICIIALRDTLPLLKRKGG